jgi:hypothetical protein
MCEAGCIVWGKPDSLVLRTVRFDPKPRTFGNYLVVVHVGAPSVCLGLPCKVLNQSIVKLLIELVGTLRNCNQLEFVLKY